MDGVLGWNLADSERWMESETEPTLALVIVGLDRLARDPTDIGQAIDKPH